MPRLPQPIQNVLAADATLAAWEARRRHEAALSGLLARHLPRSLAQRVRVVDATGAELVVATDAGAIAAAVKQRIPDLLAALGREGRQFSVIRVRVQVRIDPDVPVKSKANQIDRASIQPLAKLARELPEGALKAALAKFVRRAG